MLIHIRERNNPFFCNSDIFKGLTEEEQMRLIYERKQCRESVVLIVGIIAAALLVGYSIFKGNFIITLVIALLLLFSGTICFGLKD